jgi:uncharacterized protein YceK
MTASNKSWLALCLLLLAAVSGCSSLVSVDRTKIKDTLFEVPDAGADGGDDDAGE